MRFARASLLFALSLGALGSACSAKSSAPSGDGSNGGSSGGSGSGSSSGSSGSSGGTSSSGNVNSSSSGGSSSSSSGGSTTFSCNGSSGATQPAAIVGTWTYSGSVPDLVNVTLILCPDGALSFAEQVAPATTPPGGGGGGSTNGVDGGGPCVTTDTYEGTYAATAAGTLTWTFASGTANAVSGCADTSEDSPGVPMTAADVDAYRAEGLVPAWNETYTTNATTLVLTAVDDAGDEVGVSGSAKTFTKSP